MCISSLIISSFFSFKTEIETRMFMSTRGVAEKPRTIAGLRLSIVFRCWSEKHFVDFVDNDERVGKSNCVPQARANLRHCRFRSGNNI